jgi:translation initiation factor 2D
VVSCFRSPILYAPLSRSSSRSEADLRLESVIHCPPSVGENQLVSIRQYIKTDDKPMLSSPIAVGRMALPGNQILKAEQGKGKAVYVSHTWKDYLWDMGSKKDIPENSVLTDNSATEQDACPVNEEKDVNEVSSPPIENASGSAPAEPVASTTISYSPQEVTELLNKSLLQAISTTLSSLPPSGFPITATLLYSNHILPSRPAFPSLVISPTILAEDSDKLSDESRPHIDTEITIKSSSHKSLTTFLKAAEKSSLLTLKAPQKHQPDILVTSVNVSHKTVREHTSFVTVRDLELKAAKKAAREEKKKATNCLIEVKEFWKPHLVSIDLFEGMGSRFVDRFLFHFEVIAIYWHFFSKSTLYLMTEIRDLLNSYITTHNLVNLRDPAYINLDDLLYNCVSAKAEGKAKNKDVEPEPTVSKFMKRDELIKNVLEKMQSWYEIRVEGKDPITKYAKKIQLNFLLFRKY